jgi:hypothetical protein
LRLPTAGRSLRLCERKEKKRQEIRSKSLLTVRFLCAFAALRAKKEKIQETRNKKQETRDKKQETRAEKQVIRAVRE